MNRQVKDDQSNSMIMIQFDAKWLFCHLGWNRQLGDGGFFADKWQVKSWNTICGYGSKKRWWIGGFKHLFGRQSQQQSYGRRSRKAGSRHFNRCSADVASCQGHSAPSARCGLAATFAQTGSRHRGPANGDTRKGHNTHKMWSDHFWSTVGWRHAPFWSSGCWSAGNGIEETRAAQAKWKDLAGIWCKDCRLSRSWHCRRLCPLSCTGKTGLWGHWNCCRFNGSFISGGSSWSWHLVCLGPVHSSHRRGVLEAWSSIISWYLHRCDPGKVWERRMDRQASPDDIARSGIGWLRDAQFDAKEASDEIKVVWMIPHPVAAITRLR